MPYWPKDDPVFAKVYNPRGVIYSYADGKIEDTGPLNIKRMETIDDETSNAAMDFMDRQVKAGKTVLLLDELYKDARLYPCAA